MRQSNVEPSPDSAHIRKGRNPLLGSSWALAWEQVKKELQLTYQEETRLLDGDTPVRMETLYDILFPARTCEEATLDGEIATAEPYEQGSEPAHAKKAARGRKRGRRAGAGRGHTQGGVKEARDETEKEGGEVAHAKKAAKGRGRGKQKAAGRGHTPGGKEGPEDTQKETAEVAQAKNERTLQRIWYSCKQYEICRGRVFDWRCGISVSYCYVGCTLPFGTRHGDPWLTFWIRGISLRSGIFPS